MGKEYAETGITINAIAPAVVRTAILDAMPVSQVRACRCVHDVKGSTCLFPRWHVTVWISSKLGAVLPHYCQVTYMTDKIPMKRTGEISEIAAMVAFIVSPEASFTTGFTFDATGGRATY